MDKKVLSEEELQELLHEGFMEEPDWDKLRNLRQEFSETMSLVIEDQFVRLSGPFTPEAVVESV